MPKLGNAYKFTETKKAEFLSVLRDGSRRIAACQAIGIHHQTFVAHYKKSSEFAKQVDLAEMEANERVEDALYQAALSGNVTAIQVWLYNRMPDTWADKRQVSGKLEMAGKDGQPFTFKVVYEDKDSQ